MTQPAPGSDAQPPEEPQSVQVEVRNRQGQRPWVVYALLAVTILVFLLQLGTQDPRLAINGMACGNLPTCIGVKINQLILEGQWWRLITPILLHGSVLHLGFNMYALYVLGPEVEHHYGHLTFLVLYLLSGFSGVVLSFMFTVQPSLGASSSIFGMLAAHAVFVFRNRNIFGAQGQAVMRSILNVALINLLISLTPGVDGWGHLGGAIGGGLFAGLAAPLYKIEKDENGYFLANQTSAGYVWLASAVVLLLFAGLAAVKLLG
ncbi:MAG: rhomboid family intramembrane serine protease [Anaerolineales bacterium]|nr:rhomboid family intramembrane serine protease [Anaerolineales bacterium]